MKPQEEMRRCRERIEIEETLASNIKKVPDVKYSVVVWLNVSNFDEQRTEKVL